MTDLAHRAEAETPVEDAPALPAAEPALAPLANPAPTAGLFEVFERRYLLKLLVQREISARYSGSFLGLLWSYINPVSQFLIYFVVMGILFNLHASVPSFAIHIFSAITIVHFFTETFNGGTRSIVRNRAIVQKMAVPLEMFPVASMLVSLYHVVPQVVILMVTSVAFGWRPDMGGLIAFALAVGITMLLGTALALLFSCANVFFRDFASLVGIMINMLRFVVPMMYTYQMVGQRFGRFAPYYTLNPIANACMLMQRTFWYGTYAHKKPSQLPPTFRISAQEPHHLMFDGVVSLIASALILVFAQLVFRRFESRIPERL